MPHGYKIRGIEPPDLKEHPPSVRKLYWSWVVELGIKAKVRDLSAGLDKDGNALRPIAEETREHRRSAMTPGGKGSRTAPPLSPAYHKSRTQSLLSGRALTTHAEFFWRYDAWTGESWDVILTYQAEQGRDVFGLSPNGTQWVKDYALKRWDAWKRAGQPSQPLATAALSSNRAKLAEVPKFGPLGIDQFNAHFRGSSPNAVPFRPAPRAIPDPTTGPGNNLLLGHVWGTARGGGVSSKAAGPPRPTPIVPAVAAPRVAAMSPARSPAAPKPKPKPQTPVSAPPAQATEVSRVFDYTSGPDSWKYPGTIKRTLESIESLHSLGAYKAAPIPITRPISIDPRKGTQGALVLVNGKAVRIEVNSRGPHSALTLAHEIGHYVETQVIPGGVNGNRLWESGETMREFVSAVKASKAYQRLDALRGKTRAKALDGYIWTADPEHTEYAIHYSELWARAYAQWAAAKSKSEELLLDLEYARDLKRDMFGVDQWADDDFAPIASAIDSILKRFGLLK